MTAEARSFVPETIIPEQLTQDTFVELLLASRELLYNAKEGEIYGQFEVEEHTDNCTVMTTLGDARLQLGAQLVIEDMPSHGVLVRTIQISSVADSERTLGEKSYLLNSFTEQPRILVTGPSANGIDSSESMARRMLVEGEPLGEKTAKRLTEELRALEATRQSARQSRIASLFPKIKLLNW